MLWEDLGVQPQGDLRPQGGLLGVLQLLDLGLQRLHLLLAGPGGLVRIDQGHQTAGADPLPLRPLELLSPPAVSGSTRSSRIT